MKSKSEESDIAHVRDMSQPTFGLTTNILHLSRIFISNSALSGTLPITKGMMVKMRNDYLLQHIKRRFA
jgi:hypothetical protein